MNMRTTFKLYFFSFLVFTACTTEQKEYLITGSIEGSGNGIAVLKISNSDRETVFVDTTKLEDGNFTFKGKTDEVRHGSISIEPAADKAVLFGLLVENANITITGKWADVEEQHNYRSLPKVEISGGANQKLNKELSEVYDQVQKLPKHQEYAKLQEELTRLRNENKIEEYYELREESETLIEDFLKDVRENQKELILKNKSLEIAGYYLVFLQNYLSLQELDEIFNQLDENVRQSDLTADIREEIASRYRVQPGQPAPDFTLETPDGSKLSLSDLKGKIVVLDFWASWCRPCRASFPATKVFYAEYKDKGVEILGVSNDSKKDDWLKALETDQLPWLQVIDEFPKQYKPALVATLYAIPFLPTWVIIDREGKIVGNPKDEKELKEHIDKLIANS
jgi:peroxiredoxin